MAAMTMPPDRADDDICLVCQAVGAALDTLMDEGLKVCIQLEQGKVTPDERADRIHILTQIISWAFKQTLTQIGPHQLMNVIGNCLSEQHILFVPRFQGPVTPPAGKPMD